MGELRRNASAKGAGNGRAARLCLAAFFFLRLGRGGNAVFGTVSTVLTARRNRSNASGPSSSSGVLMRLVSSCLFTNVLLYLNYLHARFSRDARHEMCCSSSEQTKHRWKCLF